MNPGHNDFNGPNTLWMGELEPWMDEFFIQHVWMNLGFPVQARVIREKGTSESLKYGFIQFPTAEMAKHCLETYNGTAMPVPDLPTKVFFRLNNAVGPTKGGSGEEYVLFIGDIGREVNDHMLYSLFREKYQSIKNAKVVLDPATGASKGYGFVRFYDSFDYQRALGEMQGYHIGSRAIRVAAGNSNSSSKSSSSSSSGSGDRYEPPNPAEQSTTNLYLSGFPPGMTEQDIGPLFREFGELASVKVLPGRGVGFINFTHPAAAEQAMKRMQGTQIGGLPVKLSYAKLTNPMRQSGGGGGGGHNPFGMYPQAAHQGQFPMAPMMAPPIMAAPIIPVVPIVPPKIELPPPDPLEPVSLRDENLYFMDPRQKAMLEEDALYHLPNSLSSQAVPLPLPLLY